MAEDLTPLRSALQMSTPGFDSLVNALNNATNKIQANINFAREVKARQDFTLFQSDLQFQQRLKMMPHELEQTKAIAQAQADIQTEARQQQEINSIETQLDYAPEQREQKILDTIAGLDAELNWKLDNEDSLKQMLTMQGYAQMEVDKAWEKWKKDNEYYPYNQGDGDGRMTDAQRNMINNFQSTLLRDYGDFVRDIDIPTPQIDPKTGVAYVNTYEYDTTSDIPKLKLNEDGEPKQTRMTLNEYRGVIGRLANVYDRVQGVSESIEGDVGFKFGDVAYLGSEDKGLLDIDYRGILQGNGNARETAYQVLTNLGVANDSGLDPTMRIRPYRPTPDEKKAIDNIYKNASILQQFGIEYEKENGGAPPSLSQLRDFMVDKASDDAKETAYSNMFIGFMAAVSNFSGTTIDPSTVFFNPEFNRQSNMVDQLLLPQGVPFSGRGLDNVGKKPITPNSAQGQIQLDNLIKNQIRD